MVARLNIVVIEDNHELRAATVEALRKEGHKVLGVDCAEAISEQASLALVDLFLIDLNLPGEDGLSLAQRIRSVHADVGIIIVTARSDALDKCKGYENGADIYMTKPVSLPELCAAVQSLSRRLRGGGKTPDALTLDVRKMTVSFPSGKAASLTSTEVALLSAFNLAPDRRVEKWQLIEALDKESANDPVATVELVIVRLRKKIKLLGVSDHSIKVIRNYGYQLCLPMKVVNSGL